VQLVVLARPEPRVWFQLAAQLQLDEQQVAEEQEASGREFVAYEWR
jgi:hypothetical protein